MDSKRLWVVASVDTENNMGEVPSSCSVVVDSVAAFDVAAGVLGVVAEPLVPFAHS